MFPARLQIHNQVSWGTMEWEKQKHLPVAGNKFHHSVPHSKTCYQESPYLPLAVTSVCKEITLEEAC